MKNALVLLLVVKTYAFVLPSGVLARQPLPDVYLDAERDAKHDIRSGSWFAFGFFCGGIGVLSAYLSSPSPDPMRLVGKSPYYVDAYVQIYESVAKKQRLKSSVLGCLTVSVLSIWFVLGD